MTKTKINVVVWCGTLAVTGLIWLIAGRTRLHLVDPLAFIGVIAAAAAVLSALLWWELATGDDRDSEPGDGSPSS